MLWESTKRLIYIQRIGITILCVVMLITVFFVLENNVNAENIEIIANDTPLEFTKYKVKSSVYEVKETQDIVPELFVEETLYDIYSDSSFEKYVGQGVPFEKIDYKPSDLVAIDSSFTANYSKRYLLREEAAIQFADMAWHFWSEFGGDKIWISSAYRSKEYQERMFKYRCTPIRCAQPGTSEHQAGLAIDMKIVSKYGSSYSLYSGSKYYKWFYDNAHKRGFHNSYQKGLEVDGYMKEGWHWRYMGTGLATELHEKGLTFAEYYKQLVDVEDDESDVELDEPETMSENGYELIINS